MRNLSEQELELKINKFLHERMNAHPELQKDPMPSMGQQTRDHVVSRVKKFTTKFKVHPVNLNLYQL